MLQCWEASCAFAAAGALVVSMKSCQTTMCPPRWRTHSVCSVIWFLIFFYNSLEKLLVPIAGSNAKIQTFHLATGTSCTHLCSDKFVKPMYMLTRELSQVVAQGFSTNASRLLCKKQVRQSFQTGRQDVQRGILI